jgi:Protein of unknown function (DUF3445)
LLAELDNHYPHYHADKARRLEERGSKTTTAYDGALELLQQLTDYLPERYPSMFRRTTVGIENLWSGESFNIVDESLAEDPVVMASRLIQDDIAILFEKPDGQCYLLSGCILLAGFWRLPDKVGFSLSDIHYSGNVPYCKEKLEKTA